MTLDEHRDAVKAANASFMASSEALKAAKAAYHDALTAALGLVPGVVVVDTRTGAEFRLSRVDFCGDTPWVHGNPRKKDGTWSVVERALFSWWRKSE